jgi:hypothetical protein
MHPNPDKTIIVAQQIDVIVSGADRAELRRRL